MNPIGGSNPLGGMAAGLGGLSQALQQGMQLFQKGMEALKQAQGGQAGGADPKGGAAGGGEAGGVDGLMKAVQGFADQIQKLAQGAGAGDAAKLGDMAKQLMEGLKGLMGQGGGSQAAGDANRASVGAAQPPSTPFDFLLPK